METSTSKKEDAILSSLKAEESRISKEENKLEGTGRIAKGSPAAAVQGAFNKFSSAVAEERHVPVSEVMTSTPAEPFLSTEELRQALKEEVAVPSLHPPTVAAKIQSAQAKYELAVEQLEILARLKSQTKHRYGSPISNAVEDETLAMLRAVTEKIMVDEIESHNQGQNVPGMDIRIFRGSAAAKAQGALAKYAQALAIERGVHEAEIEAAASFYSPIPNIEDVVARLENEAETRLAYEKSERGRVVAGNPASRVASAARKLKAVAQRAPSIRGGIPVASQLLQGEEPLFVLGVTPDMQNETLSLLKRDAADRQSVLARRTGGGVTPSPSSAASAEVALNKYATGLSVLRNAPVPDILKSIPYATDVEIDVNPPTEILNRLRHEAVVLLVETRRAGTKNVEKGSAASYMQSAVGHYGTSLRMRLQEDTAEPIYVSETKAECSAATTETGTKSSKPTYSQEGTAETETQSSKSSSVQEGTAESYVATAESETKSSKPSPAQEGTAQSSTAESEQSA